MDLNLTDSQYEFFNCDKRFCLFRGGVGSGKTFVGSNYVIKKVIENPEAKGFIGANTYKQLQNSTLAALFNVLDDYGLPWKYNKHNGILTIGSTEIITMSLENYNIIRGMEIGWFWLDEVRDSREEAFLVLIGRLRDKRATKFEGRLTSTPAGFDWQYDYFDGDKCTKDFYKVEAASQDNPFLPDGYVDSLRASYDDRVYQQEVLGKIVNITQGQIYYAFSREKHITQTIPNKKYPLWIGMDFNINPMTAVVCQTYDNNVYVLDEFYLMTSDTSEMAKSIISKYGRGHRIVPDSTGKRTQTSSAGFSDHDILREHGFKVISTKNPFRIDRYNTVNNLLEKSRVFIDNRCDKLIRDLEQVSYKEGSNLPDITRDKTLTHISDALGYLCYYSYPILTHSSDVRMIKR